MYLQSFVISIVFLLFKFIEMRFVDKESRPFKDLLRDTLIVFLSSLAGFFVLEQLATSGLTADAPIMPPPIFTGNPEF
jgi:hypothetical protein